MSKMTYDDYLKMIRNPDVPDEDIAALSMVVRGDGDKANSPCAEDRFR